MTGSVPSPDDEIERRLAALKAGADPGTLGPPPSPARAQTAPDPWPASGGASESGEPALVGEVLDGTWRPPAGAPAGGGERAGPGVRAVSWGISQAEAGRLGLWIGIGLVAFGAYLVLADFVPGVATLGSLALTVLGGALVGWHVAGRAGGWALNGGAILAGFGAARLIADLAGLPLAGWGTLGAGLGLLALAARRTWRREGIGWQGWLGGALTVFGGWGALGAVIPGFPTLGDLIVPAALVLVGVVVLRRGMRPGTPVR
jgi:hypothetical protein